MGRYDKNVSAQRKVLTVACAVLGVVLTLLIMMLVRLNADKVPESQGSGTTADTVPATTEAVYQLKELLVESVTEQEHDVLVVTTYGTVRYSYAFSDLIIVEAENFVDHVELKFGATIDDEVRNLYTLIFDGEEGIPIGTLQVDDDTYAVTAQFHDVSGISEDGMVTFYAVQETFNDVVNSLSENEGFTAAD